MIPKQSGKTAVKMMIRMMSIDCEGLAEGAQKLTRDFSNVQFQFF